MSLALSGSAVKPTFFASLAPRLASIPQLIRPSWSIPCEPSSSSSPSSSTPAGLHQAQPQSTVTSLFPSLSGLLELFPPMLLHTPKKKVSRARRGKALQAQWLKNRTNISVCPACGHTHLTHNLCHNCFSQITRRWKAEARGEVFVPPPLPKKFQPDAPDVSSA
ncbi:hypothetical protein DB88DRAFT_507533 [Papiliotrema laurentii]|uniref:Large ribosomal subunit protein bL32m n=1 Tax=Papiliotrema laurentii TaxID=5418 RepID=A0AAD9FWS5_PAPLA|nr:hypothetical protein DB88DRAFT_507533 [Papiliotrema laurentii]